MKKKVSSKNHVGKRNLGRHVIPVVVWLVAVAVVVWLFQQRAQRFQVLGVAQKQVRQVATNCPGRVRNIPVRLFDHVAAGQVIAVVDTVLDNDIQRETLQAQLNTMAAEIERLAAQLVSTQEEMESDRVDRVTTRITDLRRFSVDVENARLRILELQTKVAADRMTLGDLDSEVKISEDLASREAISAIELEKVKTQRAALAASIEDNESLLQQAQANLETAQQRLTQFDSTQPQEPSIENALEVTRKAIHVEENRVKEVLAQIKALGERQELKLTSPVDGVVSHIWRNAGETVIAGDPIVTIAQGSSNEVIGYAGQQMASLVRGDMTVEVIKVTEPMQVVTATVTFVGPQVEEMPAQLWQNPNVPEWGRPFTVAIPPNFAVLPGEVVGIRGF